MSAGCHSRGRELSCTQNPWPPQLLLSFIHHPIRNEPPMLSTTTPPPPPSYVISHCNLPANSWRTMQSGCTGWFAAADIPYILLSFRGLKCVVKFNILSIIFDARVECGPRKWDSLLGRPHRIYLQMHHNRPGTTTHSHTAWHIHGKIGQPICSIEASLMVQYRNNN